MPLSKCWFWFSLSNIRFRETSVMNLTLTQLRPDKILFRFGDVLDLSWTFTLWNDVDPGMMQRDDWLTWTRPNTIFYRSISSFLTLPPLSLCKSLSSLSHGEMCNVGCASVRWWMARCDAWSQRGELACGRENVFRLVSGCVWLLCWLVNVREGRGTRKRWERDQLATN